MHLYVCCNAFIGVANDCQERVRAFIVALEKELYFAKTHIQSLQSGKDKIDRGQHAVFNGLSTVLLLRCRDDVSTDSVHFGTLLFVLTHPETVPISDQLRYSFSYKSRTTPLSVSRFLRLNNPWK